MTRKVFDAANWERLRSWAPEIAKALLPADTRWHQEGNELRASGSGGLSINTTNGAWIVRSTGKGGHSPLALIRYLKACDTATAIDWAQVWLQSHPGAGPVASVDDVEIIHENVEMAEEIGRRIVLPAGTPAKPYLHRVRGIPTDTLPADLVRYLPNARPGEGAIVGRLTEGGQTVGWHLRYLTPDGEKSPVRPYFRRFMLRPAPGAIFEIPAPNATVTDLIADTAIVEGLEDVLSVHQLGKMWRLEGLPGIGSLRHRQPRKKNERILVIRDGDRPGSGGSDGLVVGLDHLLLAGATISVPDAPPYRAMRDGAAVMCTDTPANENSNSLWKAGGAPALLNLIGTHRPAELSTAGVLKQLSGLSKIEFDRVGRETGKALGINMDTLRAEVAAHRPKPAETPKRGAAVLIADIEPSEEAVAGGAMLSNISEALLRYVKMAPHQADAVALYAVYTHAADLFDVSPDLIVDSPQKRSGKTRTSNALSRIAAKALPASSITGAGFARVIDKYTPTLFIDEFDKLANSNAEMASMLHGLLNSGFDRSHAYRIVMTKGPGGEIEELVLSTFCPVVLSGISVASLSDQLVDRSIRIELARKLRGEKVAPLRRRDGDDLRALGRQCARWIADHGAAVEAADPTMPGELNDRAQDAWAPLLAIADVAGGGWPERARAAARKLSGDESESASTASLETDLLSDIRDCFASWKQNRPDGRLASADITKFLNDLEDRPWGEINRGRPLTKTGLARMLKPFHITPSTTQIGSGQVARDAKGYRFSQFKDAFERYLPPSSSDHAPISSVSSVGTSEPEDLRGELTDFEPSEAPGSDGSKTTQAPHDTATSYVPTDEMPKTGVWSEEDVEKAEIPVSDTVQAELKPNGLDITVDPTFAPIAPKAKRTRRTIRTTPRTPQPSLLKMPVAPKAPKAPRPATRMPDAISARIKLTRPTHRKPLTEQEQDIITYALENPGHSIKAIAKLAGMPAKEAAELLGRDA